MSWLIPFSRQIPKEDRRAYCIDAISSAYYGLYIGFCSPFVPVLLKRAGATPFQLGLALAAPFLSLVLVFPFFRFFKEFKAIDLVVVPTFFSRFMVFSIGITSETWVILGVYLISQLVEGFGLPPYTRVLKAMYSNENRGMAMGYVRSIWGFFNILASILGGAMLDQDEGALLFLLAGLCGAISSWNFKRIFEGKESPDFSAETIAVADIWKTNEESEGFFWLNLTVTIFGFGNLLVYGVLPTFLVEKYNISNTALGNLTSLTNLMLVISYALIGRFVISRGGAYRGLCLAMTAGVLCPWLFYLAPSINLLSIPYALNGIMYAGFELSWFNLVLSLAPEGRLAAYSSVYTFILGLRGILGTFFSNLGLPFLGINAFLVLSGIFTILGLGIGILGKAKFKEA